MGNSTISGTPTRTIDIYRGRFPKSSTPTTSTTSSTSTWARSTTVLAIECEGRLILYSKTYHRGDQLELTSSDPDLASSQFSGVSVSALVSGQCCWQLYSSTLYSGELTTLRPGGDYTSVTSLGNLFRNTRSVRRFNC